MGDRRTDIDVTTGTLDVGYGREQLARRLTTPAYGAARANDSRVPVLISGFIHGIAGAPGGPTRSFALQVTDLHVDADYTVNYGHDRGPGSPFDLTPGVVERLDRLAESTEKSGMGLLSSADYHAQGRVSVPSLWLRELVSAYRTLHPEASPFYFSISQPTQGDLAVQVRIVAKDHWNSLRKLGDSPLADELGTRIPPDGTEIEPGVFAFDIGWADHLGEFLREAGLTENDEVAAASIR